MEELYALADEIIGVLKTLEGDAAAVRTTSEDTLFSVATSTAPSNAPSNPPQEPNIEQTSSHTSRASSSTANS